MPAHRCVTCRSLVYGGSCPRCAQRREQARPGADARGYTSLRWREVRLEQLASRPFCSVCGGPATDVDHLERHTGPTDPKFWDWDNLDSKCHACHSKKTARHDSDFLTHQRVTDPSPRGPRGRR